MLLVGIPRKCLIVFAVNHAELKSVVLPIDVTKGYFAAGIIQMRDSKNQEIKLGDTAYIVSKNINHLGTIIGLDKVQYKVCLCFGPNSAAILGYPVIFTDDFLLRYISYKFDMIGNIKEYFGEYIYWFDVLLTTVDNQIKINLPIEKPCQVCSRMNDIDKKSCWWCSNIPF